MSTQTKTDLPKDTTPLIPELTTTSSSSSTYSRTPTPPQMLSSTATEEEKKKNSEAEISYQKFLDRVHRAKLKAYRGTKKEVFPLPPTQKINDIDSIAKRLKNMKSNFDIDEKDIPKTYEPSRSSSAASSMIGLSKYIKKKEPPMGHRQKMKKLVKDTFKHFSDKRDLKQKDTEQGKKTDDKKQEATTKLSEEELKDLGKPPAYPEGTSSTVKEDPSPDYTVGDDLLPEYAAFEGEIKDDDDAKK